MNPAAALSHRALLNWSRWSYERSANPHTTAYWRLKRHFLTEVLADPAQLSAFLNGAALPAGYGLGFDERVVEYPWLFSRLPRRNGLMLDAGSVLNHPELLRHPRLDPKHLHIVTLAPESHCDWSLGVSYLFHDLRDLPIRDGVYDTIVSLSTIEHIGMDNQRYAGSDKAAAPSEYDFTAAVRELRRVLAPGGTCYISMPYGVDEDCGWYRPFDAARLDCLVDTFKPTSVEQTYYRYEIGSGWQIARAADCVGARTADAVRRRGLVASEAVVCLQLSA
jgi:SAM-dependent methyltransferase